MRVFLDTNVLVSAFVSRGLCTEIFELVLLAHDLIVGRNVLRELEKALRVKVRLSAARSTEIIDFVSSEAVQVVDEAEPVVRREREEAAGYLDDVEAEVLTLAEVLFHYGFSVGVRQ